MINHYAYAVLPLSWVGAKRRPSQFDSNKNAPGTNYSIPPEGFREVGPEGPEITPAPEDRNEGDFKNDGFTSTALRTALQNNSEEGQLEVQELPEQK